MRRLILVTVLAGLAGCAQPQRPITLDAGQSDTVRSAQDYLNGLTRFEAHFTQTGWLGAGAGVLWVDRPGRLRLTYAGPAAKDMVADHGLFTVYDHATGATTTTPVARTPLGLLLAAHIALSGTVAVTRYEDAADNVALTLQDTAQPKQGTLTLRLAKHPLRLDGVTATDLYGRGLTLTLTDLDDHPLITDALFRLGDATGGS